MPHRRVTTALVLLLLTSLIGIYAWTRLSAAQTIDVSKARPYRVLEDEMGNKIVIGIEVDIDSNQLRATLTNAADEHQYDAPRDYLFSDYLWVEAYLMRGERQSSVAAGRLRRYVPPRNPSKEGEDWLDLLTRLLGRRDRFYLTVEEAKRTLP